MEREFDPYISPPEPYDEEVIPKEERKWVPDYYDELIPRQKGFLTDFIYATRGIETPTIVCLWTGIVLLEAILKRETWLVWHPNELYTNQYVIIVGDAGRTKKSTVINNFVIPIIRRVRNYIVNPNLRMMKQLKIVRDKITPEGLIDFLNPEHDEIQEYILEDEEGIPIVNEETGEPIVWRPTSEALLLADELSTLLTRRSYADTLTDILLRLFDTTDEFIYRTKAAGEVRLRKLHTVLFGGTTVDGLRMSIPQTAKGDGFLSRTVVVYAGKSKRVYPMPFHPKGAPTIEELARRLAWVVENNVGAFCLDRKAYRLYTRWYAWYRTFLNEFEGDELKGVFSRMDVHLLKLSLLMRVQRYVEEDPKEESGRLYRTVNVCDVEDALKLLMPTYSQIPYLLSKLGVEEEGRAEDAVKRFLMNRPGNSAKRSEILKKYPWIRPGVLSSVVSDMVARGVMRVWVKKKDTDELMEYAVPTGSTHEIYEYFPQEDMIEMDPALAWEKARENVSSPWEQWFEKLMESDQPVLDDEDMLIIQAIQRVHDQLKRAEIQMERKRKALANKKKGRGKKRFIEQVTEDEAPEDIENDS